MIKASLDVFTIVSIIYIFPALTMLGSDARTGRYYTPGKAEKTGKPGAVIYSIQIGYPGIY